MNKMSGSIRPGLILAGLCALATAGAQSTDTAGNDPRPGQTFRECRNCPDIVVLPAGARRAHTPTDGRNYLGFRVARTLD